ncbi:MAG: hypothetical protein V3V25_09355 [Paracoccaceae bacterium]
MVGPSKILTVSYGTFSCTLEGFDDPFSTMRGIAEYFRDLAADDRYFGAEPPIPDAEMLHRIAESDAKNRVVAHVEDNGVTLRQVENDQDDAPMVAAGVGASTDAVANDPFVDEPADIVALNEPSQVEAESVAAKLARIRAVVSNDNGATEEDNETMDEEFTSSPISAAFEDTDAIASEDDAVAEESDDFEAEVEPDVVPEDQAEVETEGEQSEDVDAAQSSQLEESEQASEPSDEPVSEEETEYSQDINDNTEDTSIAEFMETATSDETESDEIEADEPENLDDLDGSSVTRIVKMRRADFEAAQELDGPDGFAEYTEVTDEEPVSSLSAEDEAELMANLETVQRKADAEERAEKEGRALLENQDIEASAESVSRILDVTNSELEETEGTRRRSAIAHLKAAVAATRADKFLSKKREKDEEEELNQYRDDLAKVVKPRRPSDSGRTARQAPLMLVSEQRVYEPTQEVASDGAAIQPRRIAAGNLALSDEEMAAETSDSENMFIENNTFAEFAEEMGASELPDLLEAAAAYSAYVEGNAHFSRPQIMQAVASLKEEEFTREEGLRSFGLLLRRGKIKKLKRGQFAVAETTRFNPQPRAVGE